MPIPNFLPVGIGLVCLSKDFIAHGLPHPALKGDTKYLAIQMNVQKPPMPVASKEEIKIFNDFMIAHPNVTGSNWINLGRKYLLLSKAKHVFPKHPKCHQ